MSEENISQKCRLGNIDERRRCFIEELNQNELMSKKHKKFFEILNYIEHLLVLVSIVTGCVSISVFLSLVGIPIVITRSAIRLKICAITAEIEKYKLIIKKN